MSRYDGRGSMRARLHTFLLAAAIIVLTLIAYWPVRQCGFVNYDDDRYVTKNAVVQRGLSLENATWAFTTFEMANWHPLTWLSYMLDVELFGVEPLPAHALNVALHIVNALALFSLLLLTTGARWRSGLVAGLFAVHPLHVESVAWIAERKDVLSTMFGLLALIAYVRFVRARSIAAYALMLVLFAFSLLAKPMLVTLPFILLLLDFWPLRRLDLAAEGRTRIFGRLLVEKIPLLVMSAASCVVTIIAQSRGGAMVAAERLEFTTRLMNAALAYVLYIVQMFWPTNLAVLYPYEPRPSVLLALTALVLIAMVSIVTVLRARRRPFLFTGWFWYLGTLVPVIGLVQVGAQSRADRYTYVPLIGLFICLAWAWPETKFGRRAAAMLAPLVLLALVFITRLQLQHWRDGVALFEHAVNVTGPNPIARNNLGSALVDAGRISDALPHFHEAIRLHPTYTLPHVNLGVALLRLDREHEAAPHFTNALNLDGREPKAHYNLGVMALGRGDRRLALEHLQASLAVEPNNLDALLNLGNAYFNQNDRPAAVAQFNRILEIDPKYAAAHNNLANMLAAEDKVDAALGHLRQAVESDPAYVDARFNLGTLLQRREEFSEAAAHLEAAVRLQPTHAGAQAALGAAFLKLNEAERAATHLAQAVRLDPSNASAQYNLGLALARAGRMSEASDAFRAAIALDPANAEACNNLGNALAATNRHAEALAAYENAIRVSPMFAAAHFNRGNVLLALHRTDDAIFAFAEAVRLNPDYADAHHNLAFALEQQNRIPEAIEHYRAVVRLNPTNEPARAALARLTVDSSPK